MGLGLGQLLKTFAPLSLYGTGILLSAMAVVGNVRLAILFMVFLLPLRNIIDRIQGFPLGNQFIDMLLGSIMVGWIVNTFCKGRQLLQKSPVNAAGAVLIIYTFLSFLIGNTYMQGLIMSIPNTRLPDWKNFCLLPIFFYVISSNVVDKKMVWTVIAVMCASMFLMDYYTVHQIHWFSNLESRDKIKGTFQFLGPNEVAAFFNQYTMILLAIYYSMKKG